MKLSNKILLITGVIFLATFSVILIRFKGLVGEVIEYRHGESRKKLEEMMDSERVSQQFSIQNFEEVEIGCTGNVSIKRSDQFNVTAIAPEELIDSAILKIKKSGNTLEIDCPPIDPDLLNDNIEIDISMPNIRELEVNDYASVYLADFALEDLDVQLSGNCELIAKNNVIKNLGLNCFGAAEADLKDSRIQNASVKIFGSNDVNLTMTGGVLKGSMFGSGKLYYYGEVENVDVETIGSTKVVKRNR